MSDRIKSKYLKINGKVLWASNEITKDDLVRVKNGAYDTIVNLEEMTHYDADDNTWREIGFNKL